MSGGLAHRQDDAVVQVLPEHAHVLEARVAQRRLVHLLQRLAPVPANAGEEALALLDERAHPRLRRQRLPPDLPILHSPLAESLRLISPARLLRQPLEGAWPTRERNVVAVEEHAP